MNTLDQDFQAHRERVFAIAYRMLGNASDADDVVQDAWLRWQACDPDAVNNAAAYLARIATTLSIDSLRRRRQQETRYSGEWLPAPIEAARAIPADLRDGESAVALAETLSVALLVLLEELNPQERAAYVLREAFSMGYDDISACLDARPATCRQWVSRARKRLGNIDWHQNRPQAERRLLEQFVAALSSGAIEPLLNLLDEQVVLISDGGGKVAAATRPIHGARAVSRFLHGLVARYAGNIRVEITALNGGCGMLIYREEMLETALNIAVSGHRIEALYLQRNPDKLTAVHAMPETQEQSI